MTLVLFSCSRWPTGSSSSGAPAPATPLLSQGGLSSFGAPVHAAPLLSQGGDDVFAAVVPLRGLLLVS